MEKSRFGRARAEEECLWIDSRKIADFAAVFAAEGWSWLENLSAMQMDSSLVFTYFVREPDAAALVILRLSLALPSAEGIVTAPSVSQAWPMAAAFEAEISELFGVFFKPGGQAPDPAQWQGFPLRKGFTLGARMPAN